MRIKNKFSLISLECLQVNLIIPFYKKKRKIIDNHFFIFRRFNSSDKIYSLDKNCNNLSFQYKNDINHIDDKNELNHNFIGKKTNFLNKQTSENKKNVLQNKNDNKYKDFHSGRGNDDDKISNNFFFSDDTHEYKNNETNYTFNDNTHEYINSETNDAITDNNYEYTNDEYNEDVDDDLDTLLLTNNLNSSLIGELWHASANSIYKNNKKLDVHDENKNKEQINDIAKTSTNIIKQIDNGIQTNMDIPQKHDNQKCKENFSNLFVNEIYEKEEKETQKMKEYLEQHEEHFSMFRNSILCKLRIAEELSRNGNHSSKENINTYNKNKEEHYKNLIDSINNTNNPNMNLNNNHYHNNNKKKKKRNYFYPMNNNINYDHVETIRILDIDNIPCNILNNLFAYNIVKNCSAELCLKIISRLGMYRDKYSQISYENMINYLGQVLNCSKNAEIIALFSRCYETISIPFLVNYVRKYGTFSRAFIVNMYDKYSKKRLFDFVRYENNMGIRKLPNILTHPYHLSSYTKLLGECSAKKDMYVQLKILGHIPDTSQITQENKSQEEIDYLMNAKKVSNKKIDNINNIDLIQDETKKKKKKSTKFIERPKIYDIILSSEYTGLPIEHFMDQQKKIEHDKNSKNVMKTLPNKDIRIEDDILHNDFIINDELDKENKKKIIINNKQNGDILNVNNNNNKKESIQSTYNMNNLNIKENQQNEENVHYNNNENTNFILDDDCDIYIYKRFNKLNNSSFKMQTTLVKTEISDENKQNNEIDLYINKGQYFQEIDKDQNNKSLWKLPWNSIKKDSFYFKGRFFKILPNEGWSEIKELSKNYIKPKRRRTQHCIKRQRILQKKIKVNLFKKKILENYNKMKKQKNEIK
ncbi:hypothetical protein PGSY75_0809400 [Plasmodium gaboni]|uniref:Uncharacterized protein n=1 Tax=Plasmodium gaboni TaxID=647221 RepID=A0A151LNK5_9APIC|nr:hypothetical protein PGSY75_0809400 [Plasmodium gaboni]KYO00689.1 hypothetical protein PGSY75_0809400 [Plasmodium gaboni]